MRLSTMIHADSQPIHVDVETVASGVVLSIGNTSEVNIFIDRSAVPEWIAKLRSALDEPHRLCQHGNTPEACAAVGLLIEQLGIRTVVTHSDLDPVRRGTVRAADGTIYGRAWDPGRKLVWDLPW